MSEQWFKWYPLERLHISYSMDLLRDSEEDGGLVIELSPCEPFGRKAENKRRIRIFFEGIVFGYNVADEGKRLKTLQYLSDQYGDEFYTHWTFFTVKNSAYKEWLAAEYFGAWDKVATVTQYTIMCDNPIIDIITMHDPVVNYIE